MAFCAGRASGPTSACRECRLLARHWCGASGRGRESRDTTGRLAEGNRMRSIPVGRVLKKVWIPLVLVVVLAVSGLVVSRLHKMFASQDLNANAVGNVVDNVIDHDGADQLFRPGCERASAQRTLAG